MTRKTIVLAGVIGLSLLGFGAETAPAGAVVCWWKFNDASNRGLDSSDYHNDLDGLSNVTPLAADTGYTTQGGYEDAVKIVKAIRDRHDGLKRNPFCEPECGHNYARSMAARNSLLAWKAMRR